MLLKYCKYKTGTMQQTFPTPLHVFVSSSLVATFVIFFLAACTFVIYSIVKMPLQF